MDLSTLRFEYERGDIWELLPFGDWHTVSKNCDTKLLYKTRDWLLEKPERRLWFGMGDHTDGIDSKDPRWDSGGIDYDIVPPDRQNEYGDLTVDWLSEFVLPIKDQLVKWHDGNHEDKFNRFNSTSLSRRVLENVFGRKSERLAQVYAPGQATTRFQFVDPYGKVCTLKVNSAHGRKTGQKVGAIINWAVDKLRSYDDVDILMRGHHHHLFAQKCSNVSNDVGHKRLRDRDCMVVGSGTALKTLQEDVKSYSEEADYLPVVLGFPVIRLTPDREVVRLEGVV